MTHYYRGFSIYTVYHYGYGGYKVSGERCRLTDRYNRYARLKDAKKDIDRYLDTEKETQSLDTH